MGFQNPAGTGPAAVKLHQVKPKQFELLEGFRYTSKAGETYSVTPSTLKQTDLASIPYVFRWFVQSYGRHTLPSLLHDCLVRSGCASTTGGPTPTRVQADDLFLEAMTAEQVPWVRRHFIWSAVSFHTRFSYSGRVARGLLVVWVLLALAGVATFAYGVVRTITDFDAISLGLALLGAVGPVLGALLWFPRVKTGVWFGYAAVALVPATLVVFPSYYAYVAVEKLAELQGGPPPPSRRNF